MANTLNPGIIPEFQLFLNDHCKLLLARLGLPFGTQTNALPAREAFEAARQTLASAFPDQGNPFIDYFLLTRQDWDMKYPFDSHSPVALQAIQTAALAYNAALAAYPQALLAAAALYPPGPVPALPIQPVLPPFDHRAVVYPGDNDVFPDDFVGNAAVATTLLFQRNGYMYNRLLTAKQWLLTTLAIFIGVNYNAFNVDGSRKTIPQVLIDFSAKFPTNTESHRQDLEAKISKSMDLQEPISQHTESFLRYTNMSNQHGFGTYSSEDARYIAFCNTLKHDAQLLTWMQKYAEGKNVAEKTVDGLRVYLQVRMENDTSFAAKVNSVRAVAHAATSVTPSFDANALGTVLAASIGEAVGKAMAAHQAQAGKQPKAQAGGKKDTKVYCWCHDVTSHSTADCKMKKVAAHLLGQDELTKPQLGAKSEQKANGKEAGILRSASKQEILLAKEAVGLQS